MAWEPLRGGIWFISGSTSAFLAGRPNTGKG